MEVEFEGLDLEWGGILAGNRFIHMRTLSHDSGFNVRARTPGASPEMLLGWLLEDVRTALAEHLRNVSEGSEKWV